MIAMTSTDLQYQDHYEVIYINFNLGAIIFSTVKFGHATMNSKHSRRQNVISAHIYHVTQLSMQMRSRSPGFPLFLTQVVWCQRVFDHGGLLQRYSFSCNPGRIDKNNFF